MKKKIIKLTESDLHRIIENSVKRLIKEDNNDTLDSLVEELPRIAQMAEQGLHPKMVASSIMRIYQKLSEII